MSIRIIQPGFLTCVQDSGRNGYQRFGVVVGGAMDSFAQRLANIIIGNDENAPVLEITLKGPTIEFQQDTLISICGADLSPSINEEPIPLWKPVFVKKGTILCFGQCKKGCRAYLAIIGGIKVPLVMGSASTYLRAGIGGFEGRQLKKGDILHCGKHGRLSEEIILSVSETGKSNWGISMSLLSSYQGFNIVRFIRGKEYHLFTEESQEKISHAEFSISPQSDRMGYRLIGEKLALSQPIEMISEAVTNGTMQVPPNGHPIILLADRQTIGGYPKIAQIAQVDLPILAQSKPGDKLRFQEVSLSEAQSLFLHRERAIRILIKQIVLMQS